MDVFTDAREEARRKGNDGNESTVMGAVINRSGISIALGAGTQDPM